MNANANKKAAATWARSVGYRVPYCYNDFQKAGQVVIVLVLALVFLPLGLIIGFLLWLRNTKGENEMNSILQRWMEAGRPTPQ